MEDASGQTTGRSWATIIGRALLGVVLTAVCIGAVMAYLGISSSIRAEEYLHSTIFVIRLVEQFVAEQRRWPRSWADLESVPFPSDAPRPGNDRLSVARIGGQHGYEWPAASKDLQRRVAVDLAADPVAVAQQDAMDFTAIRPIGPYYEYRDYGFVQSLQQTIRGVEQIPPPADAQ